MSMQEEKSRYETVRFGRYPQYSSEPEPIEWLVLTRDRDCIQLISRYSLAVCRYDRTGGHISEWDSCRLRKWLNNDFLYAAFNAEERMRLATTDVPRVLEYPLQYGHDRPDTRDRVYLLSRDEAQRFFPTNASRICDLVPRAKKVEKRDQMWYAVQDGEEIQYRTFWGGLDLEWVLRSPRGYRCDEVDWDGGFLRYRSCETPLSVRPVVRVWRREARDAQMETLRRSLPGDTVTFGRYPRSGDEPEPIEWQVLSREGGAVRLISRYVLDARPWHGAHEKTSWANCDLREWLNDAFLNAAFSKADQDHMMGVRPGDGDRVSLLSAEELHRYFHRCETRACFATPFALRRGKLLRRREAPCWWWLSAADGFRRWRSAEDWKPFYAAGVNDRDRVPSAGRYHRGLGGVRPTIVVRIEQDKPDGE